MERLLQAVELWASGLPGWVVTVGLILGAAAIGWLSEKVCARWLRGAATRKKAEWGDMFVAAIHRMPVLWFLSAGVYVAVTTGGYPEPWPALAGTAAAVTIVATVMIVAMRLSVSAIAMMARRSGGNLTSTTLVTNLVRLLLLIIGGALVFQVLGVEITTLVTALGISGLAVALALQDTLGNLFAGMQIIMSRQINPGDYVALASGEEGHVTDVQARNTTIRTYPECNRVLVPNGILASTVVTNYSLPAKRLLVRLPVGVAYDSDLEKVESVTLAVAGEVLREVEGGLTDEEPFVRFVEFSDFSINFILRVPVREFADQYRIRHMLVKRLHKRYAAEGIEIPFPIRTVYMRDQDRPGGSRIGAAG